MYYTLFDVFNFKLNIGAAQIFGDNLNCHLTDSVATTLYLRMQLIEFIKHKLITKTDGTALSWKWRCFNGFNCGKRRKSTQQFI